MLNADQALERAGTVRVVLSRGRHQAVLTVADNGRGIDEDVAERIFEPLFTTRAGGTGMGLASANRVVVQHGGQISCRSNEGPGAFFEVRLPLSAPLSVPDPADAVSSVPNPAPQRIWVLDDHCMVRLLAERILAGAGHIVRSFADASTLLEALNDDAPDLLLCDVIMPETTGPELEAEVRRRGARTSVLFMSGYAPGFLRQRLSALSVNEVLTKPFSSSELLRAVNLRLLPP